MTALWKERRNNIYDPLGVKHLPREGLQRKARTVEFESEFEQVKMLLLHCTQIVNADLERKARPEGARPNEYINHNLDTKK